MADPSPQAIESTDVWKPLRGPFERWPLTTDFLIALLSFGLTLLMWAQGPNREVLAIKSMGSLGICLCAVTGNFALLWRRSHPWQVHGVVLSAAVIVLVASMSDGIFALAISLYSLGRFETNRRMSMLGVLVAFVLVFIDLFVLSVPSIGGTLAAGLVIAFWYVGRRLRFRGEYLRLLEERAEHLERERSAESERAVAAERTRIAREMHDIVAHQVSLMTVQAGAAKTVSKTDPDAANEAMAAVEKAGRHALTEMRHLLGVLRPAGNEDTLIPQPGINSLPALVKEVSDAGPNVTLNLDDSVTDLPARLHLCIYRLVQEALTNVIKHAGDGVDVTIDIECSDELIVTIRDNGMGLANVSRSNPLQSGGHGLAGMKERVELLDGSLAAGPVADGRGFEIRAELPLERLR